MQFWPVQAAAAPVVKAGQAAGGVAASVSTSFANMLHSALARSEASSVGKENGATAASGPATGVTSAQVAEVQAQTNELLESFRRQIVQLLSANGIDVSGGGGGVHLRVDEFGQVRVAGDHPQKREIETLLAGHSELEDAFGELAGRCAALRSLGRLSSGTDAAELAGGSDLLTDPSASQLDLFLDASGLKPSFVPAGR